MPENDTGRMEWRAKWWLLIASLVTLAVLVGAAVKENFLADWYRYQNQYSEILHEKATDDQGRMIADRFQVQIVQNVVPDLGRIDRCMTCHVGVDDPRMADQSQPFTTHPGTYLEKHDPTRFGCTVCHQGQGRATEIADAHGRVSHWDFPMLEKQNLKATCSKCHLDEELYGLDAGLGALDETAQPDFVVQGKRLAAEKGCFGCHALNGRGGTVGPDISFVGDKTRHQFDFTHFEKHEPREVEYWLRKHFLEPNEISPGTLMPDLGLDEQQADALTAYMLSLRKKVALAQYRPSLRAASAPVGARAFSGEELYQMNCSSCHGKDGRESEVPGIRTPALNNVDAQAVAGDDYYRFIIAKGRSGSAMPAWGPGKGNLSQDEIDRIVGYIRRWQPAGAKLSDISARTGDVLNGRSYYQGLCGNCHGNRGEGGIGNALNVPTFLSIASDRFLAEAIVNGRPGTAMASWKQLPAQGVSDILAYIRSWQAKPPSFRMVQEKLRTGGAAIVKTGAQLYRGNCASCHGSEGEGGIGVRLNTQDVLRVVDNEFLYRSIVEGRPSTAMPAWSYLPAEQVAALIAYLRSWQDGMPLAIAPAPPTGDYALGEVHYRVSCQGCHGEQGVGGVGSQLSNPEFLRSVSDEVLFHWIGKGRTGTAMKGFLYGEQGVTGLKASQIADVIAYLRYLGTREDPGILRSGAGDANLGAQLFKGSCASCHGMDGEGASGPQLNNPSFLRAASDGFLAATIVLGRTGTPMKSMVHGLEGLAQVEPAQVQDVIAYMRQWEFPDTWRKPRLVAEMSPRAIASGQELYEQACSGCHGPKGLGERDGPGYFAPALNNPEFLSAASDGFLLATIARGRSRTPMRPFGKGAGGIASLEAEQISDIVSFIRTWQEK
ncbi:MAG: c-type cytochrome [bacterium]|nr:c-type cytochrome [bacterium]